MDDPPAPLSNESNLARIQSELTTGHSSRKRRAVEKFLLAAVGSIPWIGGFLSAAASFKGEEDALKKDNLQTRWLEEHQTKIDRLGETLSEVEHRFEKLGPGIEERIQSEEYLSLVRQAFRAWDEAETDEKRRYAANLVTNAAGTRICGDDVIRLFIDWLELYHEAHFAVIRQVYQNPGVTRAEIWTGIYGRELPREDSAEADLFKLIVRDLSTGGVLRQERDTNVLGQFVRKRPAEGRGGTTSTLESAFENSKPYVLTELGSQFVHYTMNEVVTRVGAGPE